MARKPQNQNVDTLEQTAQNSPAPVEQPEQPRPAFKPDKLGYLVWFASLAPLVLAVVNMGTKGGKKNARGIPAVLSDIASAPLTAFFAYTEALKPYSGLHFSADDVRSAGLNPDEPDSKAKALVGKSLADFAGELLKTADSRGAIVGAAIHIGQNAASRGIASVHNA